ncbi:hypothetical protein [Novosphingobium sp. Rr 2-17]|nr:hypothetical protein [Novosphingobium sp. Rr 2-17]
MADFDRVDSHPMFDAGLRQQQFVVHRTRTTRARTGFGDIVHLSAMQI